jgi:hypothetical protein
MRWVTDYDSVTFLARRVNKGWTLVGSGDGVDWRDADGEFTLSDPVVVVPAPTDEERRAFVTMFRSDADYSNPGYIYAAKVAQALLNQEATR